MVLPPAVKYFVICFTGLSPIVTSHYLTALVHWRKPLTYHHIILPNLALRCTTLDNDEISLFTNGADTVIALWCDCYCGWGACNSKISHVECWTSLRCHSLCHFLFSLSPRHILCLQVSGQSASHVQLSVTMDACARIRGVPVRSRPSVRKEVCLLWSCVLFWLYL